MSRTTSIIGGASAEAFAQHAGYQRMFAPERLTLGIFLPLRAYAGEMQALHGQARHVEAIDKAGFAAVWVRDVPLFVPSFGDAGQLFDPFGYLAYLAARTRHVALVTGSAIATLRHPVDLAKAASTVDVLSGGRLVLGVASGDRPAEFPAYGLAHAERAERFAQALPMLRQLLQPGPLSVASPLGHIEQAQLLPQPVAGRLPLLITGASGQSADWIAAHADGWLTYPDETVTAAGPLRLAAKIRSWRARLADGGFRPHASNEWLDLSEDPNEPRTALHGGYVLRTGRKGLIDLLAAWQAAGVNHAALGVQFSQRPVGEVLQELAEEVLPLFPSHPGVAPATQDW